MKRVKKEIIEWLYNQILIEIAINITQSIKEAHILFSPPSFIISRWSKFQNLEEFITEEWESIVYITLAKIQTVYGIHIEIVNIEKLAALIHYTTPLQLT